MRRGIVLALILSGLGGMAEAESPETSPLPKSRPQVTADAPLTFPDSGDLSQFRPRFRPETLIPVVEPQVVTQAAVPHPRPRPDDLLALASAAPAPKTRKQKKAALSMQGAVCGDPAIKGEVLAPIKSSVKGCGVAEPVSVTSIDGVRFSQPAKIDCDTAKTFKTWIQKGMRPAFGNREVVGLHIFGSYMCRPRNNQRGAKVSEHGRGKAVDVAGFVFADGKELTVLRNYNKEMRRAHKAACGIFGTTLGPGSDGFHENHLHFDTASYRSGSYCR